MKYVDYNNPNRSISFNALVGKTLTKIEGGKGSDSILFTTTEGDEYQLWHDQDCCESVSVDDVCGDWDEIIGTPILQAEENSNSGGDLDYGSSTWTFYRIGTRTGQVVIRWYGSSNGYYSESVTFSKLQKNQDPI